MSALLGGESEAADRDEGGGSNKRCKNRQTGRQKPRERGRERKRQPPTRRSGREGSHRGKEADILKERHGKRQTVVSSGITEHCNRLESHQLGSAQVGLAADFLAVSLPTTAHGNMILQQTQNNPRRSHLAGFGRKRNNRFKFPRGFILA